MSGDSRVEGTLRAVGVALLLSAALPVGAGGGGEARFLYEVTPGLSAVEAAGAWSGVALGAALVVGSWVPGLGRRGLTLGAAALWAAAWLLGAQASAVWEGLLEGWGEGLGVHTLGVLGVLGMLGGAGALLGRQEGRLEGRGLLVAGWVGAALLLAAPTRGEPWALHLAREALEALRQGEARRVPLGQALWLGLPMLVSALGVGLWRGAPTLGRAVTWLTWGGVATLVVGLGWRGVVQEGAAVKVLLALHAAILLGALLRVPLLALEVAASTREGASAGPLASPRLELAALASAAALGWGALALAPQPEKGVVEWTLGEPTEEADAFFGRTLPEYMISLIQRNQRLQEGAGSAEAAVRLRRLDQQLQREALAISPALHAPVVALTRTTWEPDTSGRAWIDHIEAINAALRGLGLPYYVDADAWEVPGQGGRFLYLKTYRVVHLKRATMAQGTFAALRLRRLDHLNLQSSLLGLSRDAQPFALVLLDEIERYRDDLVAPLLETPPRCAQRGAEAPAWSEALDLRCGERLRAEIAAAHPQLREALEAAAQRRAAWERLRPTLEARGVPTLTLDAHPMSPDTRRMLRALVDAPEEREQIAAVERADDRLQALGPDPLAPLTEALIRSTERHELQHQIDGPGLPTPRALYRLMPGASEASLHRAARETSGYLVEFTLEPLHAQLELSHMLLFLRGEHPSAERYAAALILQQLTGDSVLREDGSTDPESLLRAWERASALPHDTRRLQATQAWLHLFQP